MAMQNRNSKFKYTTIYLLIVVLLIALLFGFLIWLPKNPSPTPGPSGQDIYNSLLEALDKETKNNFEVTINTSKVDSCIYKEGNMYVNYTYNDTTTILYTFSYKVDDNINTILEYINTNKKLPDYHRVPSYEMTISTSGEPYTNILEVYFNKNFTRVRASEDLIGTYVYATGLIKNDDSSISIVDQVKINKDTQTIVSEGIKDDIINDSKSYYYNLVNYILTIN